MILGFSPNGPSASQKYLLNRGCASPFVVGGTGGSGTRLVVQLLRSIGVNMGAQCNGAGDAIAFINVYSKWVNPYLSGDIALGELDLDLLQAIQGHGECNEAWGWKNPRSIFLWPAFAQLIPGCRFIHVVRDGLSMATSANQNQLRQHGQALLGDDFNNLSETARSLLMWAKVNARAFEFGQQIGSRYQLLRIEDVFEDPPGEQERLARQLGLGLSSRLEVDIKPRRKREVTLSDFPSQVAEEVAPVLARFGYACK